MSTIAFVPIKAVSRRLQNKNFRDFAGINGGLSELKISQLRKCEHIDHIVLWTDIPYVKLGYGGIYNNISVVPQVSSPDKTTSQMHKEACEVLYDLGFSDKDVIVWAQVTNPLFTRYDEAISKFRIAHTFWGAQSLLGVQPLQKFIVDKTCKPLNYEWTKEIGYWPRTQIMEEVYEINSTVSVVKLKTMADYSDRVVRPVEFLITDSVEGLDIDTKEDFDRAEYFFSKRHKGL